MFNMLTVTSLNPFIFLNNYFYCLCYMLSRFNSLLYHIYIGKSWIVDKNILPLFLFSYILYLIAYDVLVWIDNEGEDFRPPRENNFNRRGRGRRGGGGDMDRRSRGMSAKRRMGNGSAMKNKRPDDEEKICQYFLQGKCLKVKNVKNNNH